MEVSSSVLQFKGEFKAPTTTTLSLKNPTGSPIAFKIKTNAPKVYSVKPNFGILAPSDSAKISITLGALTQTLPKNYRSNHKFLIMGLPCEGVSDVSEISANWSNLQEKFSSQVTSTKVRVEYVTGDGQERLNGKSKRISKFVANGSANESGSGAGAGAAAGAGGIIAAAGAAGAAAAHNKHRNHGHGHNNNHNNSNGGANTSGAHPYREMEPSTPRQTSSYPISSPSSPEAAPSSMALTRLENKIDELSAEHQRYGKKLENAEKLLVIALMLLSFILGKSVV
ncbi:hypothetical protein CLIB1444_06S00782 [[Candida] jaroonii]|uniref:Uncharacterized protein n=1 Tax=[Candida] jaroonii TaxID=467808 RepID=A0ACA9Y9Q3_9ASCO|nr:hypothetical protein CLIB1444_06S00782 [[Candida] jaroonii]